MPLTLESEVKYLKGVGPRGAAALAKANLFTVRDVLQYMPRRWEDRANMPPIHLARPGEHASIRGRVVSFDARPVSGGRVVIKALVKDETGSILLTWWNAPYMRQKLEHYRGEVIAYGLVKDNGLAYEIASPDLELVDEDDDSDDFRKIVPVYPLVQGLAQNTVRRAVESALTYGLPMVEETLPREMLAFEHLPPIRWAMTQIHRPESEIHRQKARMRLVFDEFLAMQLHLLRAKARLGAEPGISFPVERLRQGEAIATDGLLDAHETAALPLDDQFALMLPFELTGAQRRVIEEVLHDMAKPIPMGRLLQGDVGSGKTAVAACAILTAVRSGYQAALMAPTEILAEQHHATLSRMLAPLGVSVELLVGKLTPSQKKKAAERVAQGLAPVAVGTHALVQQGVSFAKLGLAVVDEQHRFGVMHRARLAQKGQLPDVLFMTATPIPRTLAMSLHGDLDVSVIDELPPGRKPVKTHWKKPDQRDGVYEGVRKLLEEGRQAYVVCPMVAESEKMQAQAAEELFLHLQEVFAPEYSVALLHGQMKPKEKEAVMAAFRAGETKILVSTTVIEVGVDVPNASVMVVEDANRFGLSQLHQLRGRVGRGANQSFCILVADATTEDAKARMDVMTRTTDGFVIAEEDLRMRGPGELTGTRQSGNLDFRLADVVNDLEMLERARDVAAKIVREDPELQRPEHAGLRQMADRRTGDIVSAAVIVRS